MKNIIYMLVLFLLLSNCSKEVVDPKPDYSTFLEKYDGTVWKYWNFDPNPPQFYIRFINNINNPLEIYSRPEGYCFEYALEIIDADQGGSITINSLGTSKDWLDNDISDDTLEYTFVTIDGGIEYQWVTSFNIKDDAMYYELKGYENDKLIYYNIIVFSGHTAIDVDSLPICNE